MKKLFRLMALVLVGVMLVMTLASCSSYGKILSNFKSEGYVELEDKEDSTAKAITAELEKGNLTCEIHILKKESKEGDSVLDNIGNALKTVVILEFSSDKALAEAIEESATLSGLIEDISKTEMVRGNCVLISIDPDAVDIFNK